MIFPASTLISSIFQSAQKLFQSRWLIVLLAFNFLIGLGGSPLFDLDEGAFSSATMEMLIRGDYVTTYMGGELRFDKPILIYWLQAASVSLFGLNEFSLRLPSALCATLWCWAIYEFCRHFLDRSKAATACILLASSLIISIIARAATADALLNLWICLALFDAYRHFNQHCAQSKSSSKYALRAYIWVGLGVLTKGPIAILIPFASITIYTLLSKKFKSWQHLLINPLGWFICLTVFLPWYMAEYLAQGQAFIDGFFLKHNLSRFSKTMENHGGNLLYYLPISLLVFMPVTGFFLQLLTHLRRFFPSSLARHFDSLDIFCWSWFLFVLTFFSFSKTQLPHYLLYGVTPIFILMAKYRDQLRSRVLVALPITLFMLLLLFLPEIGQYIIAHEKKIEVVAMLQDGLPFLDVQYRLSILFSLLLILIILFRIHPVLWLRQILVSIIFSLTIIHVVIPAYASIQQQPVKQAGIFAQKITEPIVMWRHDMPSFSIYLQKVVPIREPKPGEVVFTGLENLQAFPNAEVLFNKGGIVLVKLPKMKGSS
ncbi:MULTISPECIES: glycosyltransferase family 39 protein [unclassified Acinetobacter]|uniref:ArnT family glycosyltransferase n=1 Tax=unclassified Acinetobacter TaxID=196816 RepID=UPI0018A8B258|nr:MULTISPECIES: glycosyltransferase family 39 protein [unclassified Acinetobacter]MBJ9951700.1 glycosyltransferase family 39 protein [Acinetobacter baumannii]